MSVHLVVLEYVYSLYVHGKLYGQTEADSDYERSTTNLDGRSSWGLYSPSSGVPSSYNVLAMTSRNLSPEKHVRERLVCRYDT